MLDNTSNSQTPTDERLGRIETALTELIASQQQTSSLILSKLESVDTDLGVIKAKQESIEADLGSVKAEMSVLRFEVTEIKEDAKQRYADLRSRTELNNDKLSLIMRELNQIAQDIRYPKFTVAETR